MLVSHYESLVHVRSLMHFIFYPQSCPPPCRWKVIWRNRSTCGKTSHPTSWQKKPSMLQWQHSNHTVLSVHSSVPTQRYSYTLQLKRVYVSEVVMVMRVVAVLRLVVVAILQVVSRSVVSSSSLALTSIFGGIRSILFPNCCQRRAHNPLIYSNLLSSGLSSHKNSFQMMPNAPPFPAMAVGLVHWSQRCASVSAHATPSLHPPTITLERMVPVFCSAVHLATCRFMPVSIQPLDEARTNG